MVSIALFHNHFDETHLANVKADMASLGAPEIRCFKDNANGIWIAFEGCHRIRAAKELNIIPTIIQVEYDSEIEIQMDDELQTVLVSDLLDSINISDSKIIDFPEEDDE